MGFLPEWYMSGYGPAGRGAICCDWLPDWLSDWLSQRNFKPPFPLLKSTNDRFWKCKWVVQKFFSLSQSGIIAPRPAGPYPDISLAGKNPMSVALTERHHKSQDNYLLGKEGQWKENNRKIMIAFSNHFDQQMHFRPQNQEFLQNRNSLHIDDLSIKIYRIMCTSILYKMRAY